MNKIVFKPSDTGKIWFCGIDQGLTGAIAFLSKDNTLVVYDMPVLNISSGKRSKKTGKMGRKKILDFGGIKQLLRRYNPQFTVVEMLQITGKPGEFKQSAQAVATSHKNGGIILGMLFMGDMPHEECRAAVWQKVFFKGKKGSDTKQLSYATATKLFPTSWDDFTGPKGGIKDGRTDAALMATYAQRVFYGKT